MLSNGSNKISIGVHVGTCICQKKNGSLHRALRTITTVFLNVRDCLTNLDNLPNTRICWAVT